MPAVRVPDEIQFVVSEEADADELAVLSERVILWLRRLEPKPK